MSDRILYLDEPVEPGDGPVRCSREVGGRVCKGVVGWPEVGSVLRDRWPDGELGSAERGFAAFLCLGCRAVYVFDTPDR